MPDQMPLGPENASRHRDNPRSALFQTLPTSSHLAQLQRSNLFRALNQILDRSDVLEGHTGCVNALSWAQDGKLLISGGDDTTIRLWQIDPTQLERDYPLTCSTVINTGHRANIFNAKMLPYSSRIVTAARDTQIRVFDLKTTLASATPGKTEIHSPDQLLVATIQCHQDAVKRIVTEDSPDLFLSVSEDGTVRQHDLRTPHNCRLEPCSAPLIDVGHPLLSMSLSPLMPYELVVAGEAPYGYVFDRRHLPRTIENTWGMVPRAGEGLTTCVRKLGRPPQPTNGRHGRDHITSARMSNSNAHEVILSFSNDGVYLYSTNDNPDTDDSLSKPQTPESPKSDDSPNSDSNEPSVFNLNSFTPRTRHEYHPNVPMIMPRRCFVGARNAATVKDANFLGPDDDWVVSGSDDGNFFIWNKNDGNLHGIYEGDSSVVNVVEGHPSLPLVAVSGIDHTIKIFSPASSPSSFSRMTNANEIIENNKRPRSPPIMNLSSLAALQILAGVRNATGNEVEIRPVECTHQ